MRNWRGSALHCSGLFFYFILLFFLFVFFVFFFGVDGSGKRRTRRRRAAAEASAPAAASFTCRPLRTEAALFFFLHFFYLFFFFRFFLPVLHATPAWWMTVITPRAALNSLMALFTRSPKRLPCFYRVWPGLNRPRLVWLFFFFVT